MTGKHVATYDQSSDLLFRPSPPPALTIVPTPRGAGRWGLRDDGRLLAGALVGCLLLPLL